MSTDISADITALKDEFIQAGKTLYERGYATGAAGNMSLLLPDGTVLATPTGSCLGTLERDRLSVLSHEGELISGDKATKEVQFHLAIYHNNPEIKAIVHLHSCYCTAYSCLKDLDPKNAIKPFTPYVVMRMGEVPVIPYYKPGSPNLARDLAVVAPHHKAFLLANHGPITGGKNITEAVNNAEELEATCKLYFVLGHNRERIAYLNEAQIAELMPK